MINLFTSRYEITVLPTNARPEDAMQYVFAFFFLSYPLRLVLFIPLFYFYCSYMEIFRYVRQQQKKDEKPPPRLVRLVIYHMRRQAPFKVCSNIFRLLFNHLFDIYNLRHSYLLTLFLLFFYREWIWLVMGPRSCFQ